MNGIGAHGILRKKRFLRPVGALDHSLNDTAAEFANIVIQNSLTATEDTFVALNKDLNDEEFIAAHVEFLLLQLQCLDRLLFDGVGPKLRSDFMDIALRVACDLFLAGYSRLSSFDVQSLFKFHRERSAEYEKLVPEEMVQLFGRHFAAASNIRLDMNVRFVAITNCANRFQIVRNTLDEILPKIPALPNSNR